VRGETLQCQRCEAQIEFSDLHPDFLGKEGEVSGYRDLSADRPVDLDHPLANTFTYQLNLTRCAESQKLTWKAGETRGVGVAAYSPANEVSGTGDTTTSEAYFKLE